MKTNIFLILAFNIILVSCSKLDLKPHNALPTDDAFIDVAGARAALNGSFASMQSVNYYGRNMLVTPEVGSDNVYLSVVNSNRFVSSYQRLYATNDAEIAGLWNTIYRVILTANNIINKIDAAQGIVAEKNDIKGQALFIRALAYLDLTRIFCKPYNPGNGANLGVPLVLQFPGKEATPKRNTLAEVYTQIIDDLNNAKNLLSATTINNKLTPSKFAASALLSRVYLYKGDDAAYTAAITEATTVINAGFTLTPIAELASFYATPASKEEIFTLRFLDVETLGSDNIGNIYLKPGYGDIRVSPDLVKIFNIASDERYKKFISPFSNSPTEYQNNKFKSQDSIQGLHSPKILRLAEVILNRAEAYWRRGNFASALTDLNTIRTTRGLNALVTVPNTQLLDSVLTERRRELMFEGHRFFDLIRNGKAIDRTYCNQPTQVNTPNCSIPANDYKVVAPIPQRERDVNPNIQQNPGY